jgi:hypothetical protein
MSVAADMQGLSDLSQCALALGLAFGAEAKGSTDAERKVRYFELFERCFHGYRVALALKMRLQRGWPAAPGEREVSDAEGLRDRSDPPDQERAEGERVSYDRDRETASVPILLKTLKGVVAEAESLPHPRPAELPTLRELLARMASPAASRPGAPRAPSARAPAPQAADGRGPAVAVLARPPPAVQATARSRLLLGAAPAPLPGTASGAQPVRRATGPPRR